MYLEYDLSNANITNITALRNLLSKVPPTNFDLRSFREGDPSNGLEDLLVHDCGTTCCVAGYMGYLPEFHEAGGIHYRNVPQLGSLNPEDTVAKFLNIPLELARGIIYNEEPEDSYKEDPYFYGKPMSQVKINDVLGALDEIISRATAQS